MSNLIPAFNRLFKNEGSAPLADSSLKSTLKKAPFRCKVTVSNSAGLLILATVSLISLSSTVHAENQPKSANHSNTQTLEACQPQWITEPLEVNSEEESGEIQVDADRLTQPQSELYELNGSVVISQPGMVLLADKIQYQREQEQMDAFGNIALHSDDLIVQADEAHINNQRQSAELLNVRYQMKPSRAHGKATRIEVNQTDNIATLEQATFTTCPIQQTIKQVANEDDTTAPLYGEKVAWQLDFDDVEINQQRRRIIGKNTTLRFHDVPIFYSPYFDFPLDNRASGLLFPEFGSYRGLNDRQSSLYYAQPYYFNLAPNYDDTLTTLFMENRGLILENEFRYLEKTGPVTHRAALTLTGLNDQQADLGVNDETVDQRWRAKLIADQVWSPNLTSSVVWHETSDESFFTDIPVEQRYKSVTNIERYIQADYRQDNWHAYAQVLNYLPLRDAIDNYKKQPEIGANYYQTFGNFRFDMTAETTQFAVASSNTTLPEAQRTRLVPALSYGINKPYGYLKANAIANNLHYSINDNANNTTGESDVNYTVMQYALRGGLLFERDLKIGNRRFLQTLEPELQYLIVPYVNQANVPLFDTRDKSLDFSNLFALNRFSGFDRIGDTQQVTVALTSKILSPEGRPFLEAGIGQIIYLDDREVSLTNSEAVITDKSDYFVKLGLTTDQLYLSSTSQFSQDNNALLNANSRLRWNYTPATKLLLNHTLTDNQLPDEKETLALGATFQFNSNWQAGTYWNYDVTNGVRNEVTNAIRYDDCCWAGELSVEKTQLENGLYNYSFQFLIEFKGLSSGGHSFQDYLGSKLNF
ncbi:MAG: LPS-assembly protein LptD [Thiotrichales bacterium]|nr:LPS-assembly protein LptD [Thiotrichales bacterium]